MYCISGNVIETLQRRRDALMQLLHPHMHPMEEIKLKPSDEECPLAICHRRADFSTIYSSGGLNHNALCKSILSKLIWVCPKPNKTAAAKEHDLCPRSGFSTPWLVL